MNDARRLIAGGFRSLVKSLRCAGIAGQVLEEFEPWPSESLAGQTKEKTN